MVLSLAFILAFVFSAIVLLIGIIIFSEIAEAMEVTLPLPSITPPNESISLGNLTANNEWQLREQELGANIVNCTIFTNISGLNVRLFPDKTLQGYCHVFKVFDKSDIIGKTLNVTWKQDLCFDFSRILVLDGAYNRLNATEFPVESTGANVGFTRALPEGLKGNGLQHSILQTTCFGTTTDQINLTLPTSILDQITIAVHIIDQNSSTDRPAMLLFDIKITDFAKWDFDSNAGGSSFITTGTQNDTGIAIAGLTSLLPLILSDSDQTQVDTFNNAQAIGFTVVGILPVALFFALFSIFSGRIE